VARKKIHTLYSELFNVSVSAFSKELLTKNLANTLFLFTIVGEFFLSPTLKKTLVE
jgi:hypothetical protein